LWRGGRSFRLLFRHHEGPPFKEILTMFRSPSTWGIAFVLVALIVLAGLFGFVGVAGYSWTGAKILFFVFLFLGALMFLRLFVKEGGLSERNGN
jgi:uncharacterized membrane protein YtjA (UPF0391 family)